MISIPEPVPRVRRTVLWCLIAAGAASQLAMLVDFVRYHPTADFVQGDAGVYWSAAGRVAGGSIIGDEPFFSIPLYTFFLAGIRWVSGGGSLKLAYFMQIVLHLATAGLLADVARRRLGGWAGIAACAMYLAAQEPAYYTTRILPGTLQLFLVAVVMWTAQWWLERSTRLTTAALGGAVGLLALAYPPALLLVPCAALWTFWRTWRGCAKGFAQKLDLAWESAGIAVLTACLLIAPATLHNWYAAGEFIPVTAHAGITFHQGNAPGSEGLYTPLAGVSAVRERMHADAARAFARIHGREGGFREIDSYFLKEGVHYLLEDPVRAVRLVARKVYWFCTGRHYSDIYYPTLEQADGWIHLLPLAPVPTAWLIGPAVVGIWCMRRARTLTLAELMLGALPLLVVAGFWYSPRYRMPAIAPLVLLTTGAVHCALRREQRDGSVTANIQVPAAAGTLITLALGMATGPVNVASGFDDPDAYRPQYAYNLGQLFLGRNEFDAALEQFKTSHELRRDEPAVLAAMVEAYAQLNRLEEARQISNRLVELAPESAASWLTLGGLSLREGRNEQAADAFREALQRDGASAEAHLGLYLAASGGAQVPEPMEHLQRSLELNPEDSLARCAFAMELAKGDDVTRAEGALRECLARNPGHAEAHLALGKLLLKRNRPTDADAHLRAAVELEPRLVEQLRSLQMETARNDAASEIAQLRDRLKKSPGDAELYSRLAGVQYAAGELANAVDTLRSGVSQAEDNATLSLELAWILSTTPDDAVRNGPEAVRLATALCGEDQEGVAWPECMDVLAAALAESGDFHRATITASNAASIAEAAGRHEMASAIRARMALYESGSPYRQPM